MYQLVFSFAGYSEGLAAFRVVLADLSDVICCPVRDYSFLLPHKLQQTPIRKLHEVQTATQGGDVYPCVCDTL